MVSGAEGSSPPEWRLMCLPLQERRAFRGTKLLPLKRHNKKNNSSTDTTSFYFPQGCWRGSKCVSDVETEAHRGGLTCGGHSQAWWTHRLLLPDESYSFLSRLRPRGSSRALSQESSGNKEHHGMEPRSRAKESCPLGVLTCITFLRGTPPINSNTNALHSHGCALFFKSMVLHPKSAFKNF